jgi:subfamily B ATP-binding cassette protein MsbA
MNVLKKISGFILPYWKYMVLALLTSFIYALLNGFTMWMSATFIETFFSPSAEYQLIKEPATELDSGGNEKGHVSVNEWIKEKTKFLIDRQSKIDTLKMVCLVVLVAFILKNLFAYIKGIFMARVNFLTVTNIRNQVYEHLQRLSLSFFERRKSGHITSVFVNDVNIFSGTLANNFGKLIVAPIQILILVILLFIINWKLTLTVFFLIPLMGVAITSIGRSIRRKSRRTYQQTAVFISILQETISSLRIIKAFAMEREEIRRFKQATEKFYHLVLRQKSLQLMANPVNEILAVIAIIVLLWYGGSQILQGGGLGPDDFVRFIVILFATFQPMKDLIGVTANLQAGVAAAERVFKILDSKPEIEDRIDAVELPGFKKGIVFKDVWFRYEKTHPYVLKEINLEINRGEIVAFVGHSGAGKSTLVDLVPRFYDVVKGEVSIDGTDIRRIKNDSLKKLFGIVTQETILFNDTLRYNISYGSREFDDASIQRAAVVANAHEFIDVLEAGYDTVVGDRGVKLSGGQRQRIAIARAILKNPPILILDEATSSLDTDSERAVQDAIGNLMKNRTVLVIAHRLSTVIHADKIVVIDKGQIIDVGPHRKLLKSCPIYRNLYEMQFQDEDQFKNG